MLRAHSHTRTTVAVFVWISLNEDKLEAKNNEEAKIKLEKNKIEF